MNLKDYQDAIDIHEQIINLKALGLIIDDEAFASEFLNDVSFFKSILMLRKKPWDFPIIGLNF